jgi:hypothetical protein
MHTQNINQAINLYTEFSYLNTEDIPQFLEQKITKLSYSDNDIICNGSMDEEKSLNIIQSGRVRVIRPMLNTYKIVGYDLNVGDIFGFEAIICPEANPLMVVSSVGDTEIYRIHKDDIIEHMNNIDVLKGLFSHYIRTINHIINP